MFCPKCGAANDEAAAVCAECGVMLQPAVADPHRAEPAYPGPATRASYAGFWKRFAALIIDSIILNIVLNLVGLAIIGSSVFSMRGSSVESGRVAAFSIVSLVVQWLYYTLMESSSTRATVGKMALGIVVTDLQGKRVSFGRANGRYWGKIVSAIILLIGFLMAAFSEKKQALHDKLADTLVVNKWSV